MAIDSGGLYSPAPDEAFITGAPITTGVGEDEALELGVRLGKTGERHYNAG
jgi:hypothetical protein